MEFSSCTTDFVSIGFQPHERATSVVRVACTLISTSIISSWWSKRVIGTYLLFFSHWLSGLFHQLAQMALSQMVLLCLTRSNALRYIQALKFVELTAGNMLAVTNVAICVNLALIVSSHRTMSRVKSITSPRLMLSFLAIAVIASATAVPFWDTVTMSGTLFWSVSRDQREHKWVLASTFFMELIAGVVMATIVLMLLLFRWAELCQMWKLHRRIKSYMALTLIAILVDLAIGCGGVIFSVHRSLTPPMIAVTWTMRHVHIALDTLVLYSSLGITARIDTMDTVGPENAPRASSEHNAQRKRFSSTNFSRRKERTPCLSGGVLPPAV